eukprot:scaffold216962_cov26-Tisochrysis_lutea.AAC.1
MLQLSAEPRVDAKGAVIGAVCVGEDVLARRRVEQKQSQMMELERENLSKARSVRARTRRTIAFPSQSRRCALVSPPTPPSHGRP